MLEHELYRLIRSRKYCRHIPKNEKKISEYLKECIKLSREINFFIFWGMHRDTLIKSIDTTIEGVNCIEEYLDRINSQYPVALWVIFSDIHMRFNRINDIYIKEYSEFVKKLFSQIKYARFVNLSKIYSYYRITLDYLLESEGGWEKINMDNYGEKFKEIIYSSFNKFHPEIRDDKIKREYIKKYIKMRVSEIPYVLRYINNGILLSFNSPIYTAMFDKYLMIIYLKKVGKNRDTIPWIPK